MMSLCEDPDCKIAACSRGRRTLDLCRVVLRLDSRDEQQLCQRDRHRALNEYFNQRLRSGRKRILVVPCKLCSNVDCCQGIVIAIPAWSNCNDTGWRNRIRGKETLREDVRDCR